MSLNFIDIVACCEDVSDSMIDTTRRIERTMQALIMLSRNNAPMSPETEALAQILRNIYHLREDVVSARRRMENEHAPYRDYAMSAARRCENVSRTET